MRGGRLLTLAGLLAGLAGCGDGGPTLHPVRGKITVKGAPADGAMLVFHPKNPGENAARPSAVAGPDGTFTVASPTGPGAPAGTYDVTVVWERDVAAGKPSDGDGREDVLRGKYARPGGSGLTATVTPGDNELPAFQLP